MRVPQLMEVTVNKVWAVVCAGFCCAMIAAPAGSTYRTTEGLLFEEQFSRALRSLHHSFNQRDAQFPFFQFEDAVNRAAGGGGDGIFQQRGMVAGFQHYAGGSFPWFARRAAWPRRAAGQPL